MTAPFDPRPLHRIRFEEEQARLMTQPDNSVVIGMWVVGLAVVAAIGLLIYFL